MVLASANSINIARLLPQSFYYVYLCAQLSKKGLPIVISVPSGNFGNLTAGIIAKKEWRAPISKFVASTKQQTILYLKYLDTGNFQPKSSVSTISNAMDVGNLVIFQECLNCNENNKQEMRKDIYGASFSDVATRDAISNVFKNIIILWILMSSCLSWITRFREQI